MTDNSTTPQHASATLEAAATPRPKRSKSIAPNGKPYIIRSDGRIRIDNFVRAPRFNPKTGKFCKPNKKKSEAQLHFWSSRAGIAKRAEMSERRRAEGTKGNPKFARTGIPNGYKRHEIEQLRKLAEAAAAEGMRAIASGGGGEDAMAAAARSTHHQQMLELQRSIEERNAAYMSSEKGKRDKKIKDAQYEARYKQPGRKQQRYDGADPALQKPFLDQLAAGRPLQELGNTQPLKCNRM
jgi:hypothetical protein